MRKVWTALRNFLHIAPTVLGTWHTCICSHEHAMQRISDAFQRPVCEISEKIGGFAPVLAKRMPADYVSIPQFMVRGMNV